MTAAEFQAAGLFDPGTVAMFASFAAAEQFFGQGPLLAFIRVLGSSVARIAEARSRSSSPTSRPPSSSAARASSRSPRRTCARSSCTIRSRTRWRTIPSGRRSPAARDRVALGALVPRAFFRYAPGPVARDELPRGDGRATARAGAPAALNGPALEVEELRHRYGERIALDGVSLRVERGELFGLLGPNGGGKSTLFRILSTLLAAGGGAARVLGYDVAREPDRVRRRLGVVFQHASVDRTLTVQENLVHHGHLYGLSGASLRAAVEAVTGRLGLAERRRDRVGTLSGGLQRRTELAKALLVGAELLLLDEPTSGLDPAARREFLGFLAELRAADGITIVLTTHDDVFIRLTGHRLAEA